MSPCPTKLIPVATELVHVYSATASPNSPWKRPYNFWQWESYGVGLCINFQPKFAETRSADLYRIRWSSHRSQHCLILCTWLDKLICTIHRSTGSRSRIDSKQYLLILCAADRLNLLELTTCSCRFLNSYPIIAENPYLDSE